MKNTPTGTFHIGAPSRSSGKGKTPIADALAARRIIEQRIIIAAAEGLIAAGCSVSVVEGEKVFLVDSTDPIAIDVALHESGEPGFLVKRVIDGALQEGWVDFVGVAGIEVTADENLKVRDALQIANALAVQLGVQRIGVGKEHEQT